MITLRMPNSTGEFLYKEFDTYKDMSVFVKEHGVSPTKVYNSGRKPTDPRYCAPFAPLYFERVTKNRNAKTPLVVAVEEVTYETCKTSAAYQNDRGCCSVISMATALNISFEEAQTFLKRAGRKPNDGAYTSQIKMAYRLSKHKVSTVANYFGRTGPTISQLCREMPRGTFVVLIRNHVLTIKNGVPQDWTSPSSRHRVREVFMATPASKWSEV